MLKNNLGHAIIRAMAGIYGHSKVTARVYED